MKFRHISLAIVMAGLVAQNILLHHSRETWKGLCQRATALVQSATEQTDHALKNTAKAIELAEAWRDSYFELLNAVAEPVPTDRDFTPWIEPTWSDNQL
jgi:hypothetical protein